MIHKNNGHLPMHYYISDTRCEQAAVFIHAAFADHT
ncbi:hypothetical protein SAMN04488579_1084 [Eubacterium barkeri]|uniref:Uncharacterized protein n=1 Tax=Eubacterium barkeri TaxID=1528 RepID=A0A1H3EQH4_EUBBA|nr:hypothetical protein SAMN04488579_1084 [Eubacterium barkeri]